MVGKGPLVATGSLAWYSTDGGGGKVEEVYLWGGHIARGWGGHWGLG